MVTTLPDGKIVCVTECSYEKTSCLEGSTCMTAPADIKNTNTQNVCAFKQTGGPGPTPPGPGPTPSNQMDVCLKGVKLSVHDLMQTLSNGFSKNWLDLAKMALETAANGIQNYEDCVKIHVDNVAEWTEKNTSQHFQECLSLAAQTTTMFVQAISDKSATEIAAAVQKLDVMGQHCMLE